MTESFPWTSQYLARFMEKGFERLVGGAISIVVVAGLAFTLTRVLRLAVARLREALVRRAERITHHESPEEIRQRIHTLSGILVKVGVTVTWSIAGMICIKQLGIDIGPILAGAGILGLAVGFGAQNLVRDVVSGFFMILEDQVAVGDVAIINGTGGLVEEINLRTIVLRDLGGVVHIFPNGTITTLSNMTKDWSAVVFEIGISYGSDPDRAMEIMGGVAEELRADPAFGPRILQPMEIFGVEAFEDNAVVIKARIRTKPIEQWTVGREYRRRLKKAFDAGGIEIPFPQRTIHWSGAPWERLGALASAAPPQPGG